MLSSPFHRDVNRVSSVLSHLPGSHSHCGAGLESTLVHLHNHSVRGLGEGPGKGTSITERQKDVVLWAPAGRRGKSCKARGRLGMLFWKPWQGELLKQNLARGVVEKGSVDELAWRNYRGSWSRFEGRC